MDEGGAIGDKVDGGVLGNRRQSLGTWDKARAVANLGRKEFYAPRAQGALKAARLYPSSNRIGRLNVTLAKFNSNSHRGCKQSGRRDATRSRVVPQSIEPSLLLRGMLLHPRSVLFLGLGADGAHGADGADGAHGADTAHGVVKRGNGHLYRRRVNAASEDEDGV